MKRNPVIAMLIIMLLTTIALFAHSSAYSKEWTVVVKERVADKYIKCQSQTVNGNRMVICSEGNFELGPLIPTKKSNTFPPKVKSTRKPSKSHPFLDAIKKAEKY